MHVPHTHRDWKVRKFENSVILNYLHENIFLLLDSDKYIRKKPTDQIFLTYY